MKVGALVIGQTPRPDLEAVLGLQEVLMRGALDLVTEPPPLEPGASFPLRTRMRDGRVVVVDEPLLEPLLQKQIESLQDEGAGAIVLLCAGPFPRLRATVPLVHPFRIATGVFRTAGIERILALVPIAEQVGPAEAKWADAGFSVQARVFPPDDLPTFAQACAGDFEAIVFDYVGLPSDLLAATRERLGIPVFDLGHLAATCLNAII